MAKTAHVCGHTFHGPRSSGVGSLVTFGKGQGAAFSLICTQTALTSTPSGVSAAPTPHPRMEVQYSD